MCESDSPSSHRRDQFAGLLRSSLTETGASDLFDQLNRLSILRYEKSGNRGCMVLTPSGPDPTLGGIVLADPMPLSNLKGVRKMLQVSSPLLAALCDGGHVYGFAESLDMEGRFVVEFHDSGWHLRHGDRVIGGDDGESCRRESAEMTEVLFQGAVRQAFGELSAQLQEQLWILFHAATHQTQGTNVLITPRAAEESARLGSQATAIASFPLTPTLMRHVTAIDGTVIMDLQGTCHAIGAILDGGVSARGDRVRGGRYNSALMYADSSAHPCLIAVISQDGMIDLVVGNPKTAA